MWKWAAIGAVFLGQSMTVNAQTISRAEPVMSSIRVLMLVQSGQIDPSKTTETTVKSEHGERETTTKTERDSEGKVVQKTTTSTEYSGRSSDPNRIVTKKVTEVEVHSEKGKVNKSSTTEETTKTGSIKTTNVDSSGEEPDRTKTVEERDKDGNPIKKSEFHGPDANKKTQETEYKGGKPVKQTNFDGKGNKTQETEFDENGKPKKVTKFAKDGSRTESGGFDPQGQPHNVTTIDPNGTKRSETTTDGKGKPTEKKEFDGRGRETSRTDAEGTTERTDYEGSTTKVRKKTVTKADGSKSVTDFKDGVAEPTRNYDGQGRQIANEPKSFDPNSNDAMIMAPNEIVAGQSFQFTIATLKGEVVANQPITLDGGPMGKIETTTDLNGVVTAKAPDNWRSLRIVAGSVSSALFIKSISGGQGAPSMNKPPLFVQPGGIVCVGTSGLNGTISGQQLTIGGKPAKIVAASPCSIKAIVPSDLPAGEQVIQLSQNGTIIDSQKVDCLSIRWDTLRNALVVGQSVKRTLRISGTTKRITVLIQDRPGDSVLVKTVGRIQSSGGQNNVAMIEFVATSPGAFSIPAEVASGNTDYEKDLENAERAKREAAGWEDSAKTQSSDALKEAYERAARDLRMAAQDWEAAADARMHGNDKKADELEKAAADREAAAKAFAEKDYEKGKACEDSARMHEREAGRK